MPPAQIFIVRHSERVDHKNPEFGKTYFRPHDSPITDNGFVLAEKLGEYLVQHYKVNPADVVILSSPLLRCVQTSHGIITGALRAAASTAALDSIPLYLEPAIMEGPYWMYFDMRHNPSVVAPDGSAFHCPSPVYNDAAFHRESTSPHVQLENPFPLHPAPHFTIKDNALADASFPDRCAHAAEALLTAPALEGKTVVLLGHGETVLRVLHALKGTVMESEIHSPAYTGFVHVTCNGNDVTPRVTVEFEPFDTPHLGFAPSES